MIKTLFILPSSQKKNKNIFSRHLIQKFKKCHAARYVLLCGEIKNYSKRERERGATLVERKKKIYTFTGLRRRVFLFYFAVMGRLIISCTHVLLIKILKHPRDFAINCVKFISVIIVKSVRD